MERKKQDNEIITIQDIEDTYNKVNQQFKQKQQELNIYEENILKLDKEIQTLEEKRDNELNTANKEVEIVLSVLMSLVLLLIQLSFFVYAYPRCLAINDITTQTIAAMLCTFTGALIAIGGIKICNKVVNKGVEGHTQNILKSKEYQQLNQKILDKKIEKERESNEASIIRRETLILTLNDCKCLIALLKQKEKTKNTEYIDESQDIINSTVSKPIRKIKTINRRN